MAIQILSNLNYPIGNIINQEFSPDEEYLAGYSEVYKAFLQNEERAIKDQGVQNVVRKINRRAEFLPGTVPTIKSLIIEVIKKKKMKGIDFVTLQTIYEEVKRLVQEKISSTRWVHSAIQSEVN